MRATPLLLAGCLLGVACAHGTDTSGARAGNRFDARVFNYSDEAGLTVLTVGADTEHAVSPGLSVNVRALADHVVNDPPPVVEPKPVQPGQPTGHHHGGVDVVTSASVLATNQRTKTDKWRFEGTAGATWHTHWGDGPARVMASARGSDEVDYRSWSGRVAAEAELFERNTTVSAFAGYGHDTVLPLQDPPGQEALWPATHQRANGGVSVTQLLSRELVGVAGVGFTHQWGTLSGPYRRALVVTTLFPEVLPSTRDRVTGFMALSWAMGGGSALHLRQGAYVDTWGVWAIIPEVSVAKELGTGGLVSFRYRYYGQAAARFYQPTYGTLEPILSGDPRLGEVIEHLGGVELRWTPLGRFGWTRSLTFMGAYELSMQSFPRLKSQVRAQVFSLGVSGGF